MKSNYDYSLLKARISSVGEERFAALMEISTARLERLLDGKCEFEADEIIRASKLLCLQCGEVGKYFFSKKPRI